jgi:hypothetical protein
MFNNLLIPMNYKKFHPLVIKKTLCIFHCKAHLKHPFLYVPFVNANLVFVTFCCLIIGLIHTSLALCTSFGLLSDLIYALDFLEALL